MLSNVKDNSVYEQNIIITVSQFSPETIEGKIHLINNFMYKQKKIITKIFKLIKMLLLIQHQLNY